MEKDTTTPSTQRFSIREATATDAPAIAELISELGYPTTPLEMAERLAGIAGEPAYRTLVAVAGANVVGVAGIGLGRYYERNGLYARLLVLAVRTGERGGGIGRGLADAAERWAAAQGARAMIVNTGRQRLEAHRFYERQGYVATGFRFVKELTLAV